MSARISLGWLAFALFMVTVLPALAADGVRVVRLSVAQGDVQIDRNTGDGWEQAIANMPVVAGTRLYAAENSRAELQFEDGSSVRMAGPAQLQLVEAAFSESGNPVNVIQVDSGTVYIDAHMSQGEDFRVQGPAGESFTIAERSKLRYKVGEDVASLAVIEGKAVMQTAEKKDTELLGGQSYNYILGQPESAVRQDQVQSQPEDGWNQQREQEQSDAAAQSGTNEEGAADLAAYGTYSDIPGYGQMWQPNDVGTDWDPYGYGAWSYYPSWGWTFVSGYPWGWTPFYYGNWCYIGGRGWWWRPGHGPIHGPHGPWGGGGWHPQPRWAGNPGHGWNAPHAPLHVAHGTVAVPGSNLRVGSITQTHAEMPGRMNHPEGTHIATGGPAGHVGATSSLVRGHVVEGGGPRIVGQKGSYAIVGGTGGARSGYEVSRQPASSTPRAAPQPGPRSSYAPAPRMPYSQSMARSPMSAPRPAAAPHVSAPHVSAPAAHFSGGGGGGFHAGGGGGGAHGGGGGAHR